MLLFAGRLVNKSLDKVCEPICVWEMCVWLCVCVFESAWRVCVCVEIYVCVVGGI